MREIKFRAWDKMDKVMCVVMELRFPDEEGSGVVTDHTQGSFERYNLMQYTGLKDKNGKEIYEGDIINTRVYDGISENPVHIFAKEVTEWNKVHAGFLIRYAQANSEWKTEYEIIGNIYENPELLKV